MTSDTRHDPLAELSAQGVAVWLDDLSRELLASGELQLLITGRHVVGVTTNPTIFASALAKGDRYDGQLSHLAELGASTETATFTVTTDDVRAACDVLSPVYQQTAAKDGRVSIEVDPRLARDAAATADMARALRSAVDRDNMFVKIPATPDGLTAITQVTSEGISVNVTLIFALARYRAVMDAYLSGLEQAAAAGRDLAAIRSVASFFISRVDSEVDTRLDRIATSQATQLKGKAAIANARLAYQAYEEVIASQRWQKLAGLGAQPQRPLWASTGIKNHAYPDTMYVTELVAPGTVNTMPGTTLAAFADHGEVTGNTIRGRYHDARRVLDQLATVGVDFDDVTGQLEREGLAKFEKSWNELSHTIAAELHRNHPARQSLSRPSNGPDPACVPAGWFVWCWPGAAHQLARSLVSARACSRSWFMAKGLVMNWSAPADSARSRVPASVWAVMARMRVPSPSPSPSLRSWRVRSVPGMSGSSMSMMIRSQCSCRAADRPSCPVAAWVTW